MSLTLNLLVLLILPGLPPSNLEEASIFCRRDELADIPVDPGIVGTIASCLKEGISLRWLLSQAIAGQPAAAKTADCC